MLHQFNRTVAVQPSQSSPSQAELIKESRRHYLRYLATLEDLVKVEIEMKRLENLSDIPLFLMPTKEYKVLQYKKDIAQFAIKKYEPVIASMTTMATMPIDDNPFIAPAPSAPPSNQMADVGGSSSVMITATPPTSLEVVTENRVNERKRSKSF